jgi:beta-mannosidase
LVFDSLDTVVGVYLNDALIFTNLDLFIPVQIRLDSLVNITKTFNLTLVFESPVKYAAGLATVYNNTYFHVLPQDCNPPEYHGECHFNFIRKTQSSFSWNWGPTFATVGVAGRSYLEYYNDTAHYMTSPLITYDKVNFLDINLIKIAPCVFPHSLLLLLWLLRTVQLWLSEEG